jgi:hypothetical protein
MRDYLEPQEILDQIWSFSKQIIDQLEQTKITAIVGSMMEDYDMVLTDLQRGSSKWSFEGNILQKSIKDLTSVIGIQNGQAQKQSIIGKDFFLIKKSL